MHTDQDRRRYAKRPLCASGFRTVATGPARTTVWLCRPARADFRWSTSAACDGWVASPACEEQDGVSTAGASEPGGALNRGMWIALRCDWRRLRRRPAHLRRRHADARNDPVPVTFGRDPASTGICRSPPLSFGDRLLTRHVPRIPRRVPAITVATGCRRPCRCSIFRHPLGRGASVSHCGESQGPSLSIPLLTVPCSCRFRAHTRRPGGPGLSGSGLGR